MRLFREALPASPRVIEPAVLRDAAAAVKQRFGVLRQIGVHDEFEVRRVYCKSCQAVKREGLDFLGGMPGFRPAPVHVVHPLPSVGAALMEELVVDKRSGFFVNHDLAGYEVPVHADEL